MRGLNARMFQDYACWQAVWENVCAHGGLDGLKILQNI